MKVAALESEGFSKENLGVLSLKMIMVKKLCQGLKWGLSGSGGWEHP